jgi:hypothetical protein
MRTILVTGKEAPPAELVEIVRRGSTSLDEVSTADLSTFVSRRGLGVDRIVFWSGHGDTEVRSLALNYATAAGADRPQEVVFVTASRDEMPVDGMARDEVLVWPRDAEKVRMMFMTGA